MQEQNATLNNDPLLLPLLEATDPESSKRILGYLLKEHAEPVIKSILGYKLRADFAGKREGVRGADVDLEDLQAEVLLHLLARLSDLKTGSSGGIADFRSYVAGITHRTFADYLRRKYPLRHSLRNKLRYFLTHQPDFALWKTDQEFWCGFSRWDGRATRADEPSSQRLQQVHDQPRRLLEIRPPRGTARSADMAEALNAIFKFVGAPVEIDAIVAILANAWSVKDRPAETEHDSLDDDESFSFDDALTDERQISIADEVGQRFYLEKLWEEITQLPSRQRYALLLNLRDTRGASALELLFITGIASPDQIAAILNLSLKQFTDLWSKLPLDDARIAEGLRATRQQVINLRKSARERLARRMSANGF